MPKRDTAVYIEGQRDLARALRNLPDELEANVKEASREIAETGAAELRAAARTKAEAKTAGSIRARGGRFPVIAAGGAKDAGRMFFGTEFGGDRQIRTRQFRPHRGTQGYFFYPTVRARGREWADLWLEGVDDAIAKWWRNR